MQKILSTSPGCCRDYTITTTSSQHTVTTTTATTSANTTVDTRSFERLMLFHEGRYLANPSVKLPYRHLLWAAQRTALRIVIWSDPEDDDDDSDDEDDDESSSIDAIVLSPSHQRFAILAGGVSNNGGFVQVMDTTTLTTMITLPHACVREIMWLDNDSLLSRLDFNMLHLTRNQGTPSSWTRRKIPSGPWLLGWAKRNDNEIVFVQVPRELYGLHSFHVCLLNIHNRTAVPTRLFTVDLSDDPGYASSFFNGCRFQVFVCDNKWLLIVPHEISHQGDGIKITPIYVYNMDTLERVQFLVQEWGSGVTRASESSRTFYIETWSENWSAPKIVTTYKLGEDGILTPVGRAFPIVGIDDEDPCVRAVGKTHVACISEEHNRDMFIYNAMTGDFEKTIPSGNCFGVVAISGKRNELLCLRQSTGSSEPSTVGVYRLGTLPRPAY
jgi:hypothetical protein